MTTQKLSSEKLLDVKLLKNLTRRRLPHILVAFLVNFFTVCVPFMLWMGDYSIRYRSGLDGIDRFISRSVNATEETMVLNLVFMFVLGIYFGIISLGYMMKRRSAHFYHALPESRETLYTTSVSSALVCAAIGGAAALAIALIQMLSYSLFVGAVLETFFTYVFKNIVFFLVAYSITVFAGSFSGNGLVQALMSLVIMFYPLALYAGFVLMRSVNAQYFWEDYYYSEEALQWLSPVAYCLTNYVGGIKILPTVVALSVCAALILGGMQIYKKRAIENSERPIIFKKLGEVLKYVLMFVVTIYVGMFFQAIGYGGFYMFFGIFCGAVISWMLFNTILAKSPKAMFKGVKGLIIFLLVFALFTAVVFYDITGYDKYVPAEENIHFADIEVMNIEYENKRFTDREMLAALSTLLRNQRDENENGVAIPNSGSNTAFTVRTVIHTKLGLPVARNYRISKYTAGAEEFLRLYANDPRLEELHSKVTYALRDIVAKGYTADVNVSTYSRKQDVVMPTVNEFVGTYLREIGEFNYDRVSKPVVATVEIYHMYDGNNTYYSLPELYDIDWSWSDLPVYADMEDTISLLGIIPSFTPPVTYYYEKEVPLELSMAFVYDTSEHLYEKNPAWGGYSTNLDMYPKTEISSKLAEEIANSITWYNKGSRPQISVFTAIDTDYVLRLCYGVKEEDENNVYYMDEYGVRVEYSEYTKTADGYSEIILVFPKGYVPESVKSLFN